MLDYLTELPQNGKEPEKMVLFLHGFGSNSEDLMSLHPFLTQMAKLENAVYVSPNAPLKCDFLNSYAWFDLDNRSDEYLQAGISSASEELEILIDHILKEHDLSHEDLIIFGFSQGCMLGLSYSLMSEKFPLAMIGFSGCAAGSLEYWQNAMSKPNGTEFFINHGDCDDVVPFENFEETVEIFEQLPINFESNISNGMGHSIDEKSLIAASNFLKKVV